VLDKALDNVLDQTILEENKVEVEDQKIIGENTVVDDGIKVDDLTAL
jgi:hypothetical protein